MKKLLFAMMCLLSSCSSDPDEPLPGGVDMGVDANDVGPVTIGCTDCTVFVGDFFDGERFVSGAVSIRDGVIEDVAETPPDEVEGEEVRLDGRTLLPGLWDMHVHMSVSGEPYAYFTDQPYWREKMKAMLQSGVTGLLDLGSPEDLIFEMRRRERSGDLLAPKIRAVGGVITAPGGHPCQEGRPPFACRLAATEADVTRHVDELKAQGADLIKIVVDGGVPGVEDERLTIAQIEAAVEAAGATPVIAHIASIDDMNDALGAGVRIFAHVPSQGELTPSDVARLEEVDALFIPTLAFGHGLADVATDDLNWPEGLERKVPGPILESFENEAVVASMQTEQFRQFATGVRDTSAANFEILASAGVRIVAGSDAGNPNTFFGEGLIRELELYVEHGLTIEEALAAATSLAAAFAGDDSGRIEAGLRADLIVVEGAVSEDIGRLRNVVSVYRAGALLEPETLDIRENLEIDESTVEAQFDETCLTPDECESGLTCQDWLFACRDSCTPLEPPRCETGVCRESRWTDGGYCRLSDGCDLLAQDCANEAACYWVGNGATECFLAWEAGQGEPCGPANSCEPGLQCSLMTDTCLTLCDPADPVCPAGTNCMDRSGQAGLSIGECR